MAQRVSTGPTIIAHDIYQHADKSKFEKKKRVSLNQIEPKKKKLRNMEKMSIMEELKMDERQKSQEKIQNDQLFSRRTSMNLPKSDFEATMSLSKNVLPRIDEYINGNHLRK